MGGLFLGVSPLRGRQDPGPKEVPNALGRTVGRQMPQRDLPEQKWGVGGLVELPEEAADERELIGGSLDDKGMLLRRDVNFDGGGKRMGRHCFPVGSRLAGIIFCRSSSRTRKDRNPGSGIRGSGCTKSLTEQVSRFL